MNIQELTNFLTMKANEASNGFADALEVYTLLHTVEKVSKELKNEIFDEVQTAVSAYGKESPERNGFRLSVSSRKQWSFSDPEIERLEALKKNRQELAKQAYSIVQKGGQFFDENGEIVPPAEFKESQFIKCEAVK
jgi:hypothetical protein